MTGERELTGLLYRADWTRLALSGTVRGAGPVVDTTFSISTPPPWMPRWGAVPEPPPPPPWFFAPEEGGLFTPAPWWLTAGDYDEVEAVVDAELGILLRCSRRSGDRLPSVTEFRTLEFGSAGEPSAFSAPAGSVFGGGGSSRARGSRERSAGAAAGGSLGDALGKALGEALGAAGKEAAKAVAGMAAGGLGAMIKYGPTRRVDPFARATEEATDPDAAMPADEPDPDGPSSRADLPVVPDEVLHLVYLGGLTAPRFAATLHEWADLRGLLAAVPESARVAGFGGVGFLVDAIRDQVRQEGAGGDHSMRAGCSTAISPAAPRWRLTAGAVTGSWPGRERPRGPGGSGGSGCGFPPSPSWTRRPGGYSG